MVEVYNAGSRWSIKLHGGNFHHNYKMLGDVLPNRASLAKNKTPDYTPWNVG